MDFRDRITDAALTDIAKLLAAAYVRYRRTRRIESDNRIAPEPVNRELDNPRPESPHVREVDA